MRRKWIIRLSRVYRVLVFTVFSKSSGYAQMEHEVMTPHFVSTGQHSNKTKADSMIPCTPNQMVGFKDKVVQLKSVVKRAQDVLRGDALHIFNEDQNAWNVNFAEKTGVASDLQINHQSAVFLFTHQKMREVLDLMSRRGSWIHGLMEHAPSTRSSLGGFWSDNQGGSLSIVEKKGCLYFIANCVRGESRHLGCVWGVAQRKNDEAIFRNKTSQALLPNEEVTITFSVKHPFLRVRGINTEAFCGLRACFDGDYVKVAPLTDENRRLVLKGALEDLY